MSNVPRLYADYHLLNNTPRTALDNGRVITTLHEAWEDFMNSALAVQRAYDEEKKRADSLQKRLDKAHEMLGV